MPRVLRSVSASGVRRGPAPAHSPDTAAMVAALGRLARALTRFRQLAETTAERQARQELAWMHDAVSGMAEVLEEDVYRGRPTVDAQAIHRAATLCAHSAEMVLHVHQCLRVRDAVQARAWLAQVLDTVHRIEELLDPVAGSAVRPGAAAG